MARKLPTKREHRIEYRPLSGIRADPRNPKAHEVDVIDGSMRRFGFIESIVVDDRTGLLISGHGRTETLTAMLAAGEPPPDGVRVAGDDWEVPVTVGWASADDVEASGALIALNRAGELGGWVDQSLLDSLERLRDVTDLDGVGYDEADIALLAGRLAEEAEPPFVEDPDHVPVAPAVPFSRLGDVWELGPHRLVCGDATIGTSYDLILEGAMADMIWTDPPYNVAVTGGTHDPRDKKNYGKGPVIQNDTMRDGDFRAFLDSAMRAMVPHLTEGGAVYVCHADTEGINFRLAFVSAGFFLHQVLIWAKQNFVFGRSDYHWQHEPILYGWRPGAAHQFLGERNQSTVWNIDRPMRSAMEHPTQKPVALPTVAIQNSIKHGRLVLDPFAGSGSTLIACHMTGRVARLIELEPKYVDVICRRYQEATGTLPTRNGKPHDFTND